MSTPNNPTPPPPPPPAPAKKPRKWPWIVFAVVFLSIVGHCQHSHHGGGSSTNSSTSSTAASPSATAAPDTSTTPQGPRPPNAKDLTWNVQPSPDGGDIVTATFKIGENLTKGLTKDGARSDTADILKYALQAYPNAVEFDVHAMADMVDVYGRSSVDQVATLTYSRANLEKIDWHNFDTNNMWNIPIADSADVHPAFLY
jgi:hypothetical protein